MPWPDSIHLLFYFAVEVSSNLGQNQPTWQISTTYDGESSRAVDGGLSTVYLDGSCSNTAYGISIWVVDLGELADIYHVDVLNRAEGGR